MPCVRFDPSVSVLKSPSLCLGLYFMSLRIWLYSRFLGLHLCLSVFFSVSISVSTTLSLCICLYVSDLRVHVSDSPTLSICLSLRLCLYNSVIRPCLYVSVSTSLSRWLCLYLSVSTTLCICPYVSVSTRLSFWLSDSVNRTLPTSLSLKVRHSTVSLRLCLYVSVFTLCLWVYVSTSLSLRLPGGVCVYVSVLWRTWPAGCIHS